MLHPLGGQLFERSARIFGRAEQQAGNLFHARHSFHQTVVSLVIQLETAVFHRTSESAVSSQPSAFSQDLTAESCARFGMDVDCWGRTAIYGTCSLASSDGALRLLRSSMAD